MIERASDADKELSNVRKCVQTEMWHKLETKQYLLVRNELSVIGKLVLRGTWIIIPSSLRNQVLHLAHKGHPGIVSRKHRLRTKVWWPGCDKDAEMFCKTCHPTLSFQSRIYFKQGRGCGVLPIGACVQEIGYEHVVRH